MSANVYSIEELLVDKKYFSKSVPFFGEKIIHAEKDNRAVWYGTNCESYLVELESGKWRTVAVVVSDN